MFISGGNDAINCKKKSGTLVEVSLKWFRGLLAQSVTSFEDFDRRLVQQFSANNKKEDRMGDFFDLLQGPNEQLKNILDRLNIATVLVDLSFMKVLSSGALSEARTVWKPRTMNEVRIRVEKHIEVEEMKSWKKRKKQRRSSIRPNIKSTINHILPPEDAAEETME